MNNFIVENEDIRRFRYSLNKGPFRNFKDTTLGSNTKLEVYCVAVYQAYLDACRTFKSSEKRLSPSNNESEKVIKSLAKSMMNYLNNEDAELNHDDLCRLLIAPTGMTYGHAQKIVNMAFKYLCCLPGAEKYVNKFAKCHMPLDSLMLEWLVRECEKTGKKIVKRNISAWSSIKGVEDTKENYGYAFYVNKIEEIRGEMVPLQLDFMNWEKMQLRLAAEEFLKVYHYGYEKKYYQRLKTMDFEELMTRVKIAAEMVRGNTDENNC